MPWCPTCRAEYRPEFRACSEPDCDNVELVEELPLDPDIVEIYAAADALEAQLLVGLLTDADIEATLTDHADHVFPTPASKGSGAHIAVILESSDEARELIISAREDEVISEDGEFL